jgi:ketosteroid isomerase-like protein
MTDRKAIQNLIEKAYEARRVGDVEGIVSIFHPNGVFQLAGSKTTTQAVGITTGHDDLRKTMTGLIQAFEFVHRDILTFLIDGDQAAVHSRVQIRVTLKNQMVTTDILDVWKFEDGKVMEFVEFVDTALLNDLMR